MPPEELLRHLQRRPFQPFVLCLTDGAALEVRHPEMVLPAEQVAEVGIPHDPARPVAARIVTVVLAHIVRLEPLPAAAAGDGAAHKT